MLLGVDRLDYTKGIEHRLGAFRELLVEGRLTAPESVLVQVASPSRDRVTRISQRTQLASSSSSARSTATSDVSGRQRCTTSISRSSTSKSPSLYRAADVMLVTPLHDGMNLVAKEFVASRVADRGVLVLSEFAGAAHELTEALLVNPHDIEGVKRAIMNALSLPEGEVSRRMRILRSLVESHTVYDWARRFLDDLLPAQ